MLLLVLTPWYTYNFILMSLEQHSETVDALLDVTVLTAMHDIAERSHPRWRTYHVLIHQLVGKTLTPLDAEWASLGVGVHEVIASLAPLQEPKPVVIERHNITGLLVDTAKCKTDVLLDVLASFRTVEPIAHAAVLRVVEEHLDGPGPRHVAMFGAALSYSLQLSDTLHS